MRSLGWLVVLALVCGHLGPVVAQDSELPENLLPDIDALLYPPEEVEESTAPTADEGRPATGGVVTVEKVPALPAPSSDPQLPNTAVQQCSVLNKQDLCYADQDLRACSDAGSCVRSRVECNGVYRTVVSRCRCRDNYSGFYCEVPDKIRRFYDCGLQGLCGGRGACVRMRGTEANGTKLEEWGCECNEAYSGAYCLDRRTAVIAEKAPVTPGAAPELQVAMPGTGAYWALLQEQEREHRVENFKDQLDQLLEQHQQLLGKSEQLHAVSAQHDLEWKRLMASPAVTDAVAPPSPSLTDQQASPQPQQQAAAKVPGSRWQEVMLQQEEKRRRSMLRNPQFRQVQYAQQQAQVVQQLQQERKAQMSKSLSSALQYEEQVKNEANKMLQEDASVKLDELPSLPPAPL